MKDFLSEHEVKPIDFDAILSGKISVIEAAFGSGDGSDKRIIEIMERAIAMKKAMKDELNHWQPSREEVEL